MTRRPTIFLAMALGAGLASSLAGTAKAQWFFGPPVLPEHAIVDVLRQDGFRRISPPILNRDVYFLNAVDPYGDAVRVIIDAYSGHIIKAHLRSNVPWVHADPYDDEPARPRVQPRPPKQALAPEPRVREPAPEIRRTPSPPKERLVKPKETPKETAKPPVAEAPQGTKGQPRVIPMSPSVPVAPLDDVIPKVQVPSTPTPYVPPAPLE